MNNDTLSLVKVVTDYAFALDTLDDYDHQRLVLCKSANAESHEEPFVQRRQQAHCGNALLVVFAEQRHWVQG